MQTIAEIHKEMLDTHERRLTAIRKTERFAYLWDDKIRDVVHALSPLGDVVDARIADSSLDLYMSGKRKDLAQVFHALRSLGLKPSSRPKPGDTSYSAYWNTTWSYADDVPPFRVYLSFSSTQCTRVLVRKEMQEVEIYETKCE